MSSEHSAMPVGAPIRVAVKHHDTPQHPDACRFHRYYLSLVDQGRLPAHADFPAAELASLAPRLFMLAPAGPVRAPLSDWRLHHVGSAITERMGVDATGLVASHMLSRDQAAHHAASYAEIAQTGRLSITYGSFEGIDREAVRVEIVHVPMIAPDGNSRWVLGLMAFDSP